MSLATAFLSALGDTMTGAEDAQLEAMLAAIVKSARQRWPLVDLPLVDFLSHLAAQVDRTVDLRQALSSLKTDELYLACACGAGSSPAIMAFEQQYFPEMEAALARLKLRPATIEELKQVLREQLFVGQANARPLIRGYAGKGQLGNWLRTVAVRAAGRWLDHEKETPVGEDVIGGLLASSTDPELQHLQQAYRGAFKEAVQQALGELADEDRILLKLHYLDQLSIDQLGTLYQIHRATAARRLAKIREALLQRTRKRLMEQLQIGSSQCESVMRLIVNHLDVTLQSFWRK